MGGAWTGLLQASVCEARLCAWELASLEDGDVVVGNREAGYSYPLLFNNLPIGLCEAVVLGPEGLFGLRIVDPDFRSDFGFPAGRQDEVGELVPATVALGAAIPFDLAEAPPLPRNSIINLGFPAGAREDATLYAAGVEVARGKVLVVGERMGFLVRRVTGRFPARDGRRSSGALHRRGAGVEERVLGYDFSRPDRFSKAQIQALQSIHKRFARNLDLRLLGEGALRLRLVDQIAASELPGFLAERGLALSYGAELVGARRGSADFPGPRPPRLFEPEGAPAKLDAASRESVERLLSGRGLLGRSPVLAAGGRTASPNLSDPGGRAEFAACLAAAWKDLVDLRFDERSEEDRASIPGWEMLVVVELERRGGSELVLAYPFNTLEPYLGLLGS